MPQALGGTLACALGFGNFETSSSDLKVQTCLGRTEANSVQSQTQNSRTRVLCSLLAGGVTAGTSVNGAPVSEIPGDTCSPDSTFPGVQ